MMKVCVNCELRKLQKDGALDDIEYLLAVAIVRGHNPKALVVDEAEVQCAVSNAGLLWREIAAKRNSISSSAPSFCSFCNSQFTHTFIIFVL